MEDAGMGRSRVDGRYDRFLCFAVRSLVFRFEATDATASVGCSPHARRRRRSTAGRVEIQHTAATTAAKTAAATTTSSSAAILANLRQGTRPGIQRRELHAQGRGRATIIIPILESGPLISVPNINLLTFGFPQPYNFRIAPPARGFFATSRITLQPISRSTKFF